MGTDLAPLANQDVDEIGIVSAYLDADYLCVNWRDALKLGYSESTLSESLRSPVSASDWASLCEQQMGYSFSHWGSRFFSKPDPRDTVAYVSSAMAELRVYSSEVIERLELFRGMQAILNDTIDEWEQMTVTRPGQKPVTLDEDPIAFPWFQPEPMSISWTEPNPKIVSADPLMAAAANPRRRGY